MQLFGVVILGRGLAPVVAKLLGSRASLGHNHRVRPGVDDLLAAPVGVALLDRLELAERGMFRPFHSLQDSDPAAVEAAAERVTSNSLGDLLGMAMGAAYHLAGPWSSGAVDSLTWAYRLAPARRQLAESVWRRFAPDLCKPGDTAAQEYWVDDPVPSRPVQAAFTDYAHGYSNGEFTWAGVWTTTAPPPEVHDELVLAWEFAGRQVSRWLLPVRPGSRVWEMERPADWARLVETFPRAATKEHGGWELPGPNQRPTELGYLLSVPGQHAARVGHLRHLVPDWAAVAHDYDGVHLSWAGFLTAEGFVSDLPDRGVAMLRYWSSERTLWLRDVFGEPGPLGPPSLSGAAYGTEGIDVGHGNPQRRIADQAELDLRLGRRAL